MAGGKKGANSGKNGKNNEAKQSEVFQAFVICEDFGQTYQPLNLKAPRCLLPVANREPLGFILDHLINHCRLQQINLCYAGFGPLYKAFVKRRFSVNNCKINFIESRDFGSTGDVLRYLDDQNFIKDPKGPPFLLVNAATITNVNLKRTYEHHRKMFEKNPYVAMTMIMSKDEQKGHFIAHDEHNKILSYVSNQNAKQGGWELELATFKPKVRSRVHLRTNLGDTGLVVCSPSVPAIFSDASNLDLATLSEFVKRMLDDAAIGGQEVLFSMIEQDEYAKEIRNFDDLSSINAAIFDRQCYPYTPSYFMRGYRQYVAKKKEVFRGDSVTCSPLAKISRRCLIGHECEIRAGARLELATIGDKCTIGEDVVIVNSIVMSGATIGKGVTIRDSIIGPNVIITDNCQLPRKSIIGEGVKLALEKSDESPYPLILSDVRARSGGKDEEDDSGSISSDESESDDFDEDYDDQDIRPIPAADHVLTDNLFQWVSIDATDHDAGVSETESCSTTENTINMEKSAVLIWGASHATGMEMNFNDCDSLESEQSDESDSESENDDVLDEDAIRVKQEEEKRRRKEDNYAKFEKEVSHSINRCLDSNLDSSDIAPEISGSRSSYEIEGAQIIQALVKIIVGLSIEDDKFSIGLFKAKTTKLHGMLSRFLCPNEEPSVKLQIQCLHEIHRHWETLSAASIHVIHFMYDHDLLEGQIITHWHAKFNGELNDNFLANISRLIDHLAESSDEESDDESD